KRFGQTPMVARTGSGGTHLYYSANGFDRLVDLRVSEDIAVEVRGGNCLVVAPPSFNRFSGGGYFFERGGWDCLSLLPPLNIESIQSPANENARWCRKGPVPEGQRGITLNSRLCRDVGFCDTFDDLLDVSYTHNEDMVPSLPDGEVVERARAVWRDFKAGKIKPMVGKVSAVKTTADEIRAFASLGGAGADAMLLWQFLRTQHAARVKRGETFRLNVRRMVEAEVLCGWTEWRWKRAIKLLSKLGLLAAVKRCGRSNGRLTSAGYSISLEPFSLTQAYEKNDTAKAKSGIVYKTPPVSSYIRGAIAPKECHDECHAPELPFEEGLSEKSLEPWVQLGVSRRTWYRKKKCDSDWAKRLLDLISRGCLDTAFAFKPYLTSLHEMDDVSGSNLDANAFELGSSLHEFDLSGGGAVVFDGQLNGCLKRSR
ncbi:MAG: hypothetical protein OEU26_36035, partial [Candidatus Tectomicrobia bacterium]|nr:hypothetical protein [Candidatus Tectomicrobia bacterium]